MIPLRLTFRGLTICFCLFGGGLTLGGTVPWQPQTSGNLDDWNQKDAIKWLSICGSPKEDWINRVIETSDGSIIAAGYIGRTDDTKELPDWTAVVLNYSATGKLLWSSAF